MTRRQFLAAPTALAAAQTSSSGGLRTISYNILACLGYPETDSNRERFRAMQPQQPARMAQELLLYAPDLISFSESVTEQTARRMAPLLGMTYVWFAPGVPSYKGYPIGFPGTIFSRLRIVESANAPGKTDPELYTRHFGRALIETPQERIAVFSAHLNPHSAAIREREISGILAQMEKDMARGLSVLLQGDLNHRPDAPEYQRWLSAGLMDTFAAKGTGFDLTANSIQPRSRIDYIWAHGPIVKRLQQARCLFEGAFRTNPQDGQSIALSDHLPVMATFA